MSSVTVFVGLDYHQAFVQVCLGASFGLWLFNWSVSGCSRTCAIGR